MSAAASGKAKKKEEEVAEHKNRIRTKGKMRRPRSTSAPWRGCAGAAEEAEDDASAEAGEGGKQVKQHRTHIPPAHLTK